MDTKPKNEDSIAEKSVSAAPTSDNPHLGREKSKLKWIVALLIIAIVAGIAAMLYFVFMNTTQKTADKTPTHFDSPDSLVSAAKTSLKGAPLGTTTINSLGGLDSKGYYVYSLPSYRTDSKTFFNKPTEGTGVGYVSDSVVASSNYKKLADFFATNNFNQTSSQNGDTGYISPTESVTYVKYAMYESTDMVCAISDVDASPTPIKNHVAYMGCATKASYKKAADAFMPFATAYTKANKDANVTELTFANPDLKEAASGYKTVVMYQDDLSRLTSDDSTKSFFQGLYYMAPGSSDWTFFTSGELGANLACSVYNTDVAKKAFAGFSCIDDTTKKVTVVQ
jgi:hypothetical protein